MTIEIHTETHSGVTLELKKPVRKTDRLKRFPLKIELEEESSTKSHITAYLIVIWQIKIIPYTGRGDPTLSGNEIINERADTTTVENGIEHLSFLQPS